MSLLSQSPYTQDEIDQTARDILSTLVDLDTPPELMRYALCRALTAVSSDDWLTLACALLDEMSALPPNADLDLLGGADAEADE